MSRQPEPQPVQLDPLYFDHRKIEPLSMAAQHLHLRMICHSTANLTDGSLTHEQALRIARRTLEHASGELVPPTRDEQAALLNTLVDARLLHETRAGYALHDFLEYQPARESIITRRRRDQERKRRAREGISARTSASPESRTSVSPHAVTARSSTAPGHPSSAAKQQLAAAAVELPGDELSGAVTAAAQAGSDPIGYVVERLADSQGHRTVGAIRSQLDSWGLREDTVLDAFKSLQALKNRGQVPHKGEAAYIVGTLRRMGEKAQAVA